ncbi:hypothetical protein F5050DRAFT_1804975 [Lentinula boryana]|uniref:Uncharacterized protein n=1 Tax=Lentinula boryana TaxID=40481 RepID=A0ABQ8QM05_9AGAR|nr:hypothetical protein F5050DRAFT_1804975 [Lentinula boryana]
MSATRTIPAQTQNHEVDDLISHLPVHTSPPSTLTNTPSSASRPSQGHRAPPSSTNKTVYEKPPRNTGLPVKSRSVSANIPIELYPHRTISPEPHQLNVGSEAGSHELTKTWHPVTIPPANVPAAEAIREMAQYQARRRQTAVSEVAPRFRPFQGQTASSSRRTASQMEEVSIKTNSAKQSIRSKGKQREGAKVALSIAPSNNTNTSNTSVSTARYMEYERGIRRRVILQLLRNMDLQSSSTTLISDQGVIMNISEGTVVVTGSVASSRQLGLGLGQSSGFLDIM